MENKKNQTKETKKNTNWVEEKEAKFENAREEFKNSKHKKGFRLIVKDIETGDILMNEAINAFVGAWAKKVPDGVVGAATLISACNTQTLFSAIENAEKAIEQAKQQVIEGTLKNPEIANEILKDLLKDIFGGK